MRNAKGSPSQPEADLVAERASRWLSREELEAHIATVIRLENVGVLLGAGASKDAGGRTTREMWEDFGASHPRSKDWLAKEQFIVQDEVPSIEALLDSLEIALFEWRRTGRTKQADALRGVRNNLWRTLISGSLLDRSWWQKPSDASIVARALASHVALLQKLTSARQPGQPSPWVFTTNYDLAVEIAAESIGLKVINGFDGVHNRVFSPHNFDLGYRNVLARGEARFGTYNVYLAKLHGSLSWQEEEDGTYSEHAASYLWPGLDSFLSGKAAERSSLAAIFPSAAKYVQTVGFVLGELLRRFTEFLSRPQACLIINGYSFSDNHLNRILSTALQNPTLQLVICLPEVARKDNELDCDKCTPWVQRVGALHSPQVTIIGGESACFGSFVEMLPDPVIYDEAAAKIRKALRDFHNADRVFEEGWP